MEFTNQFRVAADLERTYRTMTDLAATSLCVPGAEVDDISGEKATGSLRVKVGPLTVRYEGSATKVGEELDTEAGQASVALDVDGEESPGAGTAQVRLHATLAEADEGTDVTVDTVVEVTGKPAQFGKAVVGDVISRMTKDFGERIADHLVTHQADEAPADPADAQEELVEPAAENADQGNVEDAEVAAPAAGSGATAPAANREAQKSDADHIPELKARPDAVNTPAGMPWDDTQTDVWELPGRNRLEDLKILVPLVLIALSAGLLWWRRRR